MNAHFFLLRLPVIGQIIFARLTSVDVCKAALTAVNHSLDALHLYQQLRNPGKLFT